jgi:predicted regulator of Ras-like GTPase activity (Roadblock/LC7/MglB family)
MIEATLRALTSEEEVQTVYFLEKDGFLIYAYGKEPTEDASMNMTRWQTLMQTAEEGAMITLVMEHGYLILHPVGTRTLIVKCTRMANLGTVRTAIREVDWPA